VVKIKRQNKCENVFTIGKKYSIIPSNKRNIGEKAHK